MTRKEFLGTLASAAAAPQLPQTATKRNLVIILADEHRFDMMSAIGHPWLQTPNLDKLIGGGALFENAFVTTSLCSQSRASILTGQYAHSHGVLDETTPLPSSLVTFPRILQQNGYRTGLIGKWHIGGEGDEPRTGFNRWVSFRGHGVYANPTLNMDGDRRRVNGYITDLLTDEARKFIAGNSTLPFMLLLSHKAGNNDFVPHERHRASYSNDAIPYPKSIANTEQNYRGRPQWVRRQRESWHGVDGMYNRRLNFDQLYRDYCRSLLSIDESVGAVMDELRKRRLLNSTLVIYTADHGFQLGEHGLIDKRTMYEPSIRIPMIAHCPELIRPDTKIESMALNIDLAPTVLEAAGVQIPTMHGRSLLPLLRGSNHPVRTEFIYEYFWDREFPQTPTTIGLRTATHSFMQYHGIWDLDELYDVEDDPEQMNNLLGTAQLRADNRSLLQRITEPEVRTLTEDLQTRLWRLFAESGGRWPYGRSSGL